MSNKQCFTPCTVEKLQNSEIEIKSIGEKVNEDIFKLAEAYLEAKGAKHAMEISTGSASDFTAN